MRRLLLVPFLFASSFLNMGFTNVFQNSKEPEIKGIICGTDLFMEVLVDNFSKESIFSGEAENQIYDEFNNIEDEYFYSFIVDINSGKLYTSEDSNAFYTSLKPLYQEKFDNDTYTYKSEKKGNSLKVVTTYYEFGEKKDSWEDDINLKTLINTYIEEGETVTHKCTDFPLPGTVKIAD